MIMNEFDTERNGHISCEMGDEEILNQYLDGELAFERQADFFQHLSVCVHCRSTFDAVLSFRRMSRQENLAVPSAVDSAFYEALSELKRQNNHYDRAVDRRPLWQLKTPVSLRSAMITAVLLFVAGFLLPTHLAPEPVVTAMARVTGEEELINLAQIETVKKHYEPVYVFYPGLTVEAEHEGTPLLDESM